MEFVDHSEIWGSTTSYYGVCRSCPNMEINHLQIWSLQIMPKYGDQPPPNMDSADHAQIWRSTTSKYGVCRSCPNMEINHLQIWSLHSPVTVMSADVSVGAMMSQCADLCSGNTHTRTFRTQLHSNW